MLIRKTALVLAVAALFAAGSHAHAQATTPGGAYDAPAFGETTPTTSVLTDQTVDAFVDPFVAVQEIREDFAQQLASVSDEAEAQAMQQQAQGEMLRAVEATGMSVQEYNDVAIALQSDPDLLERVQEMAKERM